MDCLVSIHRRHDRAGNSNNSGGESSRRDHVIGYGRQAACGQELVESLELLEARDVAELVVAAHRLRNREMGQVKLAAAA